MMWWMLLFLIPAVCGFFAIRTGKYPFKVAVTGSCLGLMILLGGTAVFRQGYWILLALLASLAGDYFLSHLDRHKHGYLCGIGAFFVAHVLYCVYAFSHMEAGNIWGWCIAGAVLAGYLFYFFRFVFGSAPKELRWAALAYLVVSCASLAGGLLIALPLAAKILYIAGIISIIVSDTMICENDFCHHPQTKAWILPLYYACHILLSIALLLYLR
ncbi:MAG: lysoplasmalogenase family protein [Eubacteriales bacterium]|nr:lysoplasmalogenase family protein [Eubacteriales bacterium]